MLSVDIAENLQLKQYIRSNGTVDYDKLKQDTWLQETIKAYETMDIDEYSRSELLAFWMNAYNLFTLKSVYLELSKNKDWKGVTSLLGKAMFFILRRHKIANQRISLYNLENRILRKQFQEPRIHFAINCASTSCPYLPERLFDAENLEEYLETLTHSFINDQGGVQIENDTLYLSKIFKWYAKDFGDKTALLAFISKYWEGESLPDNPKIEYLTYDWSLNRS